MDASSQTFSLASLCADIDVEQLALTMRLGDLSPRGWALPTPADGWTVKHTVSHLCYFTEVALEAVTDPASFIGSRQEMAGAPDRPDIALVEDGPELCRRWSEATSRLVDAIQGGQAPDRIPWYGPSMSKSSFITARIMETWAHGQDIADALDLPPIVSTRLRHICHLGIRTRGFSYELNGLEVPASPVRVSLEGPRGDAWSWGPDDGRERIEGAALDFALVVTQRRNVLDTGLRVVGRDARHWMELAQVFAGPPGTGRPAGWPNGRRWAEPDDLG